MEKEHHVRNELDSENDKSKYSKQQFEIHLEHKSIGFRQKQKAKYSLDFPKKPPQKK